MIFLSIFRIFLSFFVFSVIFRNFLSFFVLFLSFFFSFFAIFRRFLPFFRRFSPLFRPNFVLILSPLSRFGVIVEDDEEHKIRSILVTSDQGRTYGPYTQMSSDYDVVNLKTINFRVGEQLPFTEVGREINRSIDQSIYKSINQSINRAMHVVQGGHNNIIMRFFVVKKCNF